jgi:MFS transporter, DHA1 family, tetracycline resistance protein
MSARLTFSFIFFTALLNAVGFGIMMPVLPQLIMSVTGEGLAAAARHGSWLLMVYAVMQFFFAPVMGNLSDRFGRRPVLLVSLAVLGIDFLIMAWAPTLAWLFVGRLIAGVAASTYSTCNAAVADITPVDRRAAGFGLLGAAFGGGFIIGPVLGGFLGEIGPRVPFVAAAMLAFANLLFGLVVMPETLPRTERRAFVWGRAHPIGAVRSLSHHPLVIGIIAAYFLMMIGHHSLPSTWSYFTMEKFSWSAREVGYSLGFVGVLMVIVQAGLLRMVLPRTGPRLAASIGFVCGIAAFAGYAVAGAVWVVYLFLVIGSLQGFVGPALNGLMSAQLPPNAQGELQGALASTGSLTAIISPLLMMQTFAHFTSTSPTYFPGAPYALAALITLVSLGVFLRVTAHVPAVGLAIQVPGPGAGKEPSP